MFRYIQSFNKGDDVPSWLIDVEPVDAGEVKPSIRFGFDCHVIEVSMGYLVVHDNETSPEAAYLATDGNGGTARVFAPSKNVHTPMSFATFGGLDDTKAGEGPDRDQPLDDVNGMFRR